MSRALTRFVLLDGRAWAPGDVPPDEVAARIRNPLAWSDEAEPTGPVPEPVIVPTVGSAEVPQADLPPAVAGRPGDDTTSGSALPAGEPVERGGITPPAGLPEPPRSGKGSSEAAWRDYAGRHGVQIDDGADRGAIIAALQDAGVIHR